MTDFDDKNLIEKSIYERFSRCPDDAHVGVMVQQIAALWAKGESAIARGLEDNLIRYINQSTRAIVRDETSYVPTTGFREECAGKVMLALMTETKKYSAEQIASVMPTIARLAVGATDALIKELGAKENVNARCSVNIKSALFIQRHQALEVVTDTKRLLHPGAGDTATTTFTVSVSCCTSEEAVIFVNAFDSSFPVESIEMDLSPGLGGV